jgi:hypothetical protein
MSNGVNGLFIFIEQGTDPTAGTGFDAPLHSLCSFDGTLYRKTGDDPTDWSAVGGGGFEGGTVPDPTIFESDVTFEGDIVMNGGAVTAAGALNLSGGSGVVAQGAFTAEGAITAEAGVSVTGNVSASGNVTAGVAGQVQAGFGVFGTVNGTTLVSTANIQAGSSPMVLAAGSGSLSFFEVAGTGQVGAIADAAGGGTVDTEARTALNLLLAAMRGYGLIDT